jgi:hypothetical protein
MPITKRKGVKEFAIGWERVFIYDPETDLSWRKIHFRVAFWSWFTHFGIRISPKRRLP